MLLLQVDAYHSDFRAAGLCHLGQGSRSSHMALAI